MLRVVFVLVPVLFVGSATAQLADPRLELQTVANGLALPTSIVMLDDDNLLVSQKNDGRVRHVAGGVVQPGEVLDLDVNFANEQGLLSMVRDPDFEHNLWIYLYFTESSTGADSNATNTQAGNRVYRYRWTGSALIEPLMILDLPADTPFPGIVPGPHNGGALAFGPDDYLYLLIGDLAQGNQLAWSSRLQNNAAGAPPNDTGVILRVDRAGRGAATNPFFNPSDPADPLNRYFAYGIRNSFGMAFDPQTGELWQSENGPTDDDEINRVFPGFNGGWVRVRGPIAEDVEGLADLWMTPGAVYGDPEFVWSHPVAPTSLAFVASPKLGCDVQHDLIVGDAVCGQLYKFEMAAGRQAFAFGAPELQDKIADNQPDACTDELGELLFGSGPGLGVITDLENGFDGRLYMTVLNTGSVMRIAPKPGAVADVDQDEVDDSCDCDPADASAFAVPRPVGRLRLSGGVATYFGWDHQRPTTGEGTTYRMLTGTIDALHTSGWSSVCTLMSSAPLAHYEDLRVPVSGDVYFYLVEASNACGAGGFDPGTGRDELVGTTPPFC